MRFNSDGTKVFLLGLNNLNSNTQGITQYSLTTPYDVSTSSYVGFFDTSVEDSGMRGFVFNTDGTEMFVVGASTDDVYKYVLSTAFDISTASYSSQSFALSAPALGTPTSVTFSPDGLKMYVYNLSGSTITAGVHEYNLSAPFDITTSSYVQIYHILDGINYPLGHLQKELDSFLVLMGVQCL